MGSAKSIGRWFVAPTSLGGHGIFNMDKFGRTLRLRWPWLAWTSPEKPWVGMENPCNDEDMTLFYGLTRVTIGDGNVACFWNAPWVDGNSPRCIAPLIYALSKRNNWSVREALTDDAWIRQIDISRAYPH